MNIGTWIMQIIKNPVKYLRVKCTRSRNLITIKIQSLNQGLFCILFFTLDLKIALLK